MRVAYGLVGLALSVVAIGACGEPHYKDADAVTCMAFLSLQSAAVSEGRAIGDVSALDASAAAWRNLAERKYTSNELEAYVAGTIESFEYVEAADLNVVMTTCQAQAPISS